MIDRLVSCDKIVTETELTVREDNLFFQDGFLREPGIVENIAQTCAARMGYINRINGDDVKIGFIGGIKALKIGQFPSLGERLNTRIEVVGEILDLTLVKAVVKCGDRHVAECEMKIAISNQ
jgi:hypothetical protein